MSAREQQFTGLRHEGHPPIPFDPCIQSALARDPVLQRWAVRVIDRSTGRERIDDYLAATADDAEVAAHHDALEANPLGVYAVRSLCITARRALWDVRLHGRAQLREALPADKPLLVGRVVAITMAEARARALAVFAPGGAAASAESWRYVQADDHFSVVRC